MRSLIFFVTVTEFTTRLKHEVDIYPTGSQQEQRSCHLTLKDKKFV
jgi:hypothetical protein